MNTFSMSYAMGHSQKALKSIDRASGPVKIFRMVEEESFESKNSSITSECKANNSINDSISFKNIFFSEGRIHSEKHTINSSKINKLKDKVKFLKGALVESNAEISKLKLKLEENYKKHAGQLQNMQEKHEIKLTKNKKDIDFLLNDLNSKSTAIVAQTFMQKHSEDMKSLQSHYENLISSIKSEYDHKLKFLKSEKTRFLRVIKLKLDKLFPSKPNPLHNLIQDYEGHNKENDSFEELSTVESECIEKKSLSSHKLKTHSSLF